PREPAIPRPRGLLRLARDRLILKDVRYPQATPAEEPNLVRFQASKELTDAAEEVVIDYFPVAGASGNGERRALAFVARRRLLRTYQDLCRAAGLKLAGVTPRPFGIAASVPRVSPGLALGWAPPGGAGATGVSADLPQVKRAGAEGGTAVAVLTVTTAWAEFCVVRDGTLLFTRALTPGDGLIGEIRRNL